jgi:hypothetical protein
VLPFGSLTSNQVDGSGIRLKKMRSTVIPSVHKRSKCSSLVGSDVTMHACATTSTVKCTPHFGTGKRVVYEGWDRLIG